MKKAQILRENSDSRRGHAAVAFVVGVAALLVALAAPSCDRTGVHTVKISGSGLDFYPDSARMLVFPYDADFRFDAPVASAVIVDGAFSLSFPDSVTRVYELVAEEDIQRRSFMTYTFFSDDEPLHFTFSRKYGVQRAEVAGSLDNEELYLYRNRWQTLCEPADSLEFEVDRWRISKYGTDGYPERGSVDAARLRAEYEVISQMLDSLEEASNYEEWLYDRITHHKTLAGLFRVAQALDRELMLVDRNPGRQIDTVWLGLYADYRTLYPDSWLVHRTDGLLATAERLRPGQPFPDFSAPSMDGNRYRLSELVEGQIAVLDCWASWCLPCRGHSIELIPLYEKYRDRGFTVVGVAREYDGLDDMRLAIEKDGYPWVQLYDLDNAEGVWDLYGLSTAGGGIFLIDREGRIVEKVADIESVRNYLEEHLGR